MKKNSTKKTITNILKVTISNVLKLLSGILIGFLLPKIIGVTDYGYYKTFTLYCTYTGLLSFGFVEGLLLIYGGKNYDELNKEQFRLYSRIYIGMQLLFAAVGSLISLAFINETRFIFLMTSMHLFSLNVAGYYQNISQMTSRFGELSIRNIILSILSSLSVVIVYIIYKFTNNSSHCLYRLFVALYLSVHFVIAVWYVITYRELLVGKCDASKDNLKNVFKICKIGLPLLISNLVSTLILALDRQFVNVLFSTEVYAIYSFAYSMFSLFTTATTAISTVLYPSLKQKEGDDLFLVYNKLVAIMLAFVFIAISLYYPLCWFIGWFLSKYNSSIPIFRIIIPGLAINSAVTIIIHNFYKASKESFAFFIQSIIVLVVSFLANLVAYKCFGTTISISVASVIVVVFWYFLSQIYYWIKHKTPFIRNTIYMIVAAGAFYGVSFINTWWIGFLIYLPASILIAYLFNFKYVNNKVLSIKNKNSEKEVQ